MTTELRSARAVSHMSPETRYVHARLEEWAAHNRDRFAQAWPAVTVLGRVAEFGPMGASQGSQAPDNVPQSVTNIERAVLKLGEIDRKVITQYYTRWSMLRIMARKCGMRDREFQRVLDRARFRIHGYLSAIE